MVKVGLLVRLVAKPGKEQMVAEFLAGALPLARAETETVTWFALRLSNAEFAIFDAFPGEAWAQGTPGRANCRRADGQRR